MSVNKKIIETEAAAASEAKFAVTTWTGNATSGSDTRDINVGFAPDIYWIRGRNFTTSVILDRVRGSGKGITTYSTNAEDTSRSEVLQNTGIQLVGTSVNYNGENAVMWSWGGGTTEETNTDGGITSTVRANTNAGYSVIKFTGTGTNTTVGHGLDSTPEFMIYKNLDQAGYKWPVHTQDIGSLSGNYSSAFNETALFNSYTPTTNSTTIGLSSGQPDRNPSGQEMIIYAFHSVSGYSKFGTYAGNGTSQTITTGFQVDYLMLRKYDDNQDWFVFDSVRDPSNPKTKRLFANLSSNEVSATSNINFTSTGFELPTAFYNDSGKNFIYAAFKIT